MIKAAVNISFQVVFPLAVCSPSINEGVTAKEGIALTAISSELAGIKSV